MVCSGHEAATRERGRNADVVVLLAQVSKHHHDLDLSETTGGYPQLSRIRCNRKNYASFALEIIQSLPQRAVSASKGTHRETSCPCQCASGGLLRKTCKRHISAKQLSTVNSQPTNLTGMETATATTFSKHFQSLFKYAS